MATEAHSGEAGIAAGENDLPLVIVGVDGSEAGLEACRQAPRIAEPGARIEAVAAVRLADAIQTGFDAPRMFDRLRREAETALEQALLILGERGEKLFVDGPASQVLLSEIDRTRARLVALGSHGHRRFTEMLMGGVSGELLHSAPCSVLIARPPREPEEFPRSILVGIDGSDAADLALTTATEIARRSNGRLRIVTALRGKDVDGELIRDRAPSVEILDEQPVESLVSASRNADLVVVGSRGLHGLRALGSVSERVAHQAACSVLVVREPQHR